ncbi:hypothetical protein CEXT_352091 [Caerostris extrusa]|uniref:Uncharacterized protein n=1 Tax=Caerostris extrusa TaxID=172846 RepID=A0AAV4WI87_CAEEX|nr:hypothetical protein CEXT_352091 [Caerostris extrusa]
MLTPYDFAIFLKSYALVAARRFAGETVFVILLNTSGNGIPACNCPAISVISDFKPVLLEPPSFKCHSSVFLSRDLELKSPSKRIRWFGYFSIHNCKVANCWVKFHLGGQYIEVRRQLKSVSLKFNYHKELIFIDYLAV